MSQFTQKEIRAEAKHSPAPWKNGRDANGDVVICQADHATGEEWNPEYQANRKLFDAAPELFAAVRAAIEWHDDKGEFPKPYGPIVAGLRAAYAKAQGA